MSRTTKRDSVWYYTPLTGATIVPNENLVVINPAGTIAALTITLPIGYEWCVVSICTSQIITALTINGGTIVGGVTTLWVGGFASYVFTNNVWYRIG